MPTDSPTRDHILDAAEQLFARQGFAATTIKQIGAAAGVNSALLYYYFDDKETLYREMLRRIISGFVAIGTKLLAHSSSPEEGIRALVRLQMEVMTTRPQVPRLIARELVDHEAAHAEQEIARLAASTFKTLCDLIEHGQRDGVFRRDLVPQFAAISVVSQVVYFNIARPAVGILLGHGPKGVPLGTTRAFADHAADFAIAAITEHSAARRGRARKSSRKPSGKIKRT
jgi:AcrR family transcriptional regulator